MQVKLIEIAQIIEPQFAYSHVIIIKSIRIIIIVDTEWIIYMDNKLKSWNGKRYDIKSYILYDYRYYLAKD